MADKLLVMLVDDSRSVLAQLETIISEYDEVEVVGTARDGAAAIRMVSELRPHLVMMDIVMPGMDGLATLRMLGASNPEVQVAMLSSLGGMPSRAEEAFRLGAVQVLGKPVEKEVLAALFESVIETREAREEALRRNPQREDAQ